MRILLTNDDGITAGGLEALLRALEPAHEVWVVAPETEKSGSSHSITLRDSIRVRQVGEKAFSCRGTPADCVLVALMGLIPKGIEMVVSGINHGPNLGTDVLYSGTAAAARQAVLMGIPSVAVSMATYSPPFEFQQAASFVARNVDVFQDLWGEDHFPNVNVPNTECRGVPVITFPSRRIYRDELHIYTAPNKDLFCFMGGALPDSHLEEGSDCEVVGRGLISISPIYVHPGNHDIIADRYRAVTYR